MKVVLISGKSGSGKDTVAIAIKSILNSQNKKVLICHYADLVKYVCSTFFDWDGKKNIKGRNLLQKVGTDDVRVVNANYWVDFIISILKIYKDKWDYVLIPDCRFESEIYRLIEEGFNPVTVRIERKGYNSVLTKEQQEHESEVSLDNFMFDIYEYPEEGLKAIVNSAHNIINKLEMHYEDK